MLLLNKEKLLVFSGKKSKYLFISKCVKSIIKTLLIIDVVRILIVGVDNGIVPIIPTKGFRKYSDLEKIKTEMSISCIRRGIALDNFAVGGIESPLKIWDLTTGQFSFTAKRVS